MNHTLESVVNFLSFEDTEQQSNSLAQTIAGILTRAITDNGHAYMAVSGGSTPKTLFKALSNMPIHWSKVTVSLVDDRWLPPQHKESNQLLVEQNLLQNNACVAEFIGLYRPDQTLTDAVASINKQYTDQPISFDVLLLGMGNDGHTASLFPCSQQLSHGLSTTDAYLISHPTSAPYDRISLSAHSIENSKHLFLQIKGEDKRQTLDKAIEINDEMSMPIQRFLNSDITVLWCP